MRPKSAYSSYKVYITNQRCEYHSKSVGHDTEECINVKHNIQHLIDQEVVPLQKPAPNVNINPLPNHRGVNMIEMDDDWCVSKVIKLIALDEL